MTDYSIHLIVFFKDVVPVVLLLLPLLMFDQNEVLSYIVALDNFILEKKKCTPLFRMTLLDSDTLLCLIKLINCLMDHKSANTLMGLGVLC